MSVISDPVVQASSLHFFDEPPRKRTRASPVAVLPDALPSTLRLCLPASEIAED
jgi:hypothetical protein